MADPLEIRPLPRVTLSTLFILGQTVRAYYGGPPEKFNPSPFMVTQGHTRSPESMPILLLINVP